MAVAKKGEGGATATPPKKAEAPAAITLESIQADHPEIAAEIVALGAAQERERLAGIDAAALPGHDQLVADMKADGSVTPDMAASRIVQAEKARRETQAQGVRDVETKTGEVAAAPSASDPVDPVVALANKPDAEKNEDDFKAEYAAGPADINKSTTSESDYVALRKAEVSGRVKVLNTR